MIEHVKPAYHASLRPFARICVQLGIHPNWISLWGVGLYCVGGYLFYLNHWVIAVAFGTIAGFMDGLDGLVAREAKKESRFGAVFDSFCDRLTEIVIYFGITAFYLKHPTPYHIEIYAAFMVISGSMLVSYVKARANAEGIACSGGIAQRPERLICIGVLALCGPACMPWGLIAMAAFSYLTSFWRLYQVYKNTQKENQQ